MRIQCPPGACICERERLLSQPEGDLRILMLTREEEKRLLARIESIDSLADLRHVQGLMRRQLGIVVDIAPGSNEVRTVMGLRIEVLPQPGLCRKTRKSIPAALRRCFEARRQVVFDLLDEHDLLAAVHDGVSRP